MRQCVPTVTTRGSDAITITIHNGDDDPIIQTLEIHKYFMQGTSYSLLLGFAQGKETAEMRSKFHSVEECSPNLMIGSEGAPLTFTTKPIKLFMEIIQEIDPIPLHALKAIEETIGLDVSGFCFQGEILNYLEKGEYDKANTYALECDESESVAFLANRYAEQKDEEHYIQLLKAIPRQHPYFQEANTRLFYNLLNKPNMTVCDNSNRNIAREEELFTYALNADLTEEATRMYHNLCGNEGCQLLLTNITGDNPEVLLEIARTLREKNQENAQLKQENSRLQSQLVSLKNAELLGTVGVFQQPSESSSNQTELSSNSLCTPHDG